MNSDTLNNEDPRNVTQPGLSGRRLRLSLATLCLAVLVVAAASGTVTALPTAQVDGEVENATTTDDGIITVGSDGPILEQLWCVILGCPEPVEVTQSETVVTEERPATQQSDSSEPAVANTTDSAESNTTVGADVSSSRGETTASAGGATDARSEPSGTQRPVVNVTIDEQASTGQWWWPLVVALLALTTVVLIAVALYRWFFNSDSPREPDAYPATLQPRIVTPQARQRASDGGKTMAAAASAETTTAKPSQLTDARAALSDGSSDQAVILSVQALANASGHDERVRRYDGLLASWESTADSATTALQLNQLRVCYEQAAFGPDPVAKATAMKCVETAEALLGARGSRS